MLRFALAGSRTASGSGTSLTTGVANSVLGQVNFTDNSANPGGVAGANTLFFPQGVAVGSDGTPWVADSMNNRVLGYLPPSTDATLSGVTVNGITASVAGSVYTAHVATGTSSATIVVTPTDSNATAVVSLGLNGAGVTGPQTLGAVGTTTTFYIKVTAQDGTTMLQDSLELATS